MKIDEAVSILRAHNEWRRAPAHLPEDAMPAMGDPRQIGIAIDTVCDALSQSDDWARALRLADDAAESVICTEGQIQRQGVWRIAREVLDADRAYLSDCLQHLAWRQMADVAGDHNTGDVIVTFRGEHPADSEATPALSTEQWRSD
jgi:hypothetical protein